MSISAEQNLKRQIDENKQRQLKISQVLKETYQQFQAEKDLDGCLNTLISAIAYLQKEQQKAIDTNKLVAQNTEEQAQIILNKVEKIVDDFNPNKVTNAMTQFKKMIDNQNYEFKSYFECKLNKITKRNYLLNSFPIMAFKFIFYSIGSLGGILALIVFAVQSF